MNSVFLPNSCAFLEWLSRGNVSQLSFYIPRDAVLKMLRLTSREKMILGKGEKKLF